MRILKVHPTLGRSYYALYMFSFASNISLLGIIYADFFLMHLGTELLGIIYAFSAIPCVSLFFFPVICVKFLQLVLDVAFGL